MTEKQVLIKYHENFADNFSSLAYAKILEKDNIKFFYENHTNRRNNIDDFAQYFNLDLNFVSSKKADSIASKSYFLTKMLLKNKNIFDKCIKNNILSKQKFDIADIDLLDDNIKSVFKFKNIDFIKNFDIFDEILHTNSIGFYVASNDELLDCDIDFIEKSISRLNKFIKKPKLFIFTKKKDFKIDTFIDCQLVDLSGFREEYYFLSKCKHHIILDTKNSYSMNFWSAFVYENNCSYITVRNTKNIKKKNIIVV